MRINKDHLYHGAALTQVAEHPTFKAINEISNRGVRSRCAFLINHDIGLYLKYATEAKGPFKEYVFTFHRDHLKELQTLRGRSQKVFVCLICVSASHICCISYERLMDMIAERKQRKGSDEEAYTVLATIPAGKSFRVYMNVPGKRKALIKETIIHRNEFPDVIFRNP